MAVGMSGCGYGCEPLISITHIYSIYKSTSTLLVLRQPHLSRDFIPTYPIRNVTFRSNCFAVRAVKRNI